MAICLIVENPDESEEQARRVFAHVRSTGPVPPDGARLVLAGPANPGWRAISVWDSENARERFLAERLAPAYNQVGVSLERVTQTHFEVDTLVAGDLTGAPQRA